MTSEYRTEILNETFEESKSKVEITIDKIENDIIDIACALDDITGLPKIDKTKELLKELLAKLY